MRPHWVTKLFGVFLFILIVMAGFGQAVLQLWNWLMPLLFGFHMITYWQALGLLCLSWILFGGLRGWPRGGGHWRQRRWERWEKMSPEEREKFRQSMRERCGHRTTATEAKS